MNNLLNISLAMLLNCSINYSELPYTYPTYRPMDIYVTEHECCSIDICNELREEMYVDRDWETI